jgi:hypothetical protein
MKMTTDETFRCEACDQTRQGWSAAVTHEKASHDGAQTMWGDSIRKLIDHFETV